MPGNCCKQEKDCCKQGENNRNFHTACLRATADLVAISDQDDLWLPHKIEWQVRAIGACNVCFSAHLRGRDMATAHTVTPRCNLEALLFTGIAGHTMLIRRDFLQRPNTWSGDRIVYDWSIAINAWFFRPPHAIVRVDEPLNWHRSHDGEAALLQNIAVCGRQRKATWQPYAYGLRNYRALLRLCRLCLRHRAALLPPHQHAPAAGAPPSGASSTPSFSHGTARSLTWSRGEISI